MIMDKIMKNIYNHFDWNEIRVLKIEKKNQDMVVVNESLRSW